MPKCNIKCHPGDITALYNSTQKNLIKKSLLGISTDRGHDQHAPLACLRTAEPLWCMESLWWGGWLERWTLECLVSLTSLIARCHLFRWAELTTDDLCFVLTDQLLKRCSGLEWPARAEQTIERSGSAFPRLYNKINHYSGGEKKKYKIYREQKGSKDFTILSTGAMVCEGQVKLWEKWALIGLLRESQDKFSDMNASLFVYIYIKIIQSLALYWHIVIYNRKPPQSKWRSVPWCRHAGSHFRHLASLLPSGRNFFE